MNSKISMLGLLLLMPFFLLSQRSISGKIYDADTQDPLAGVNILVKGTTHGTSTDIDGNYSLDNVNTGDVLQFAYIGYADQEIVLGNESVLNVNLRESVEALEEVLVVGYGVQKKKDATGSLENVSPEEFNKGAIVSPEQLIAGKTAGVQITPPGGEPGQGGTIKIRGGTSSISNGGGSTQPLIVVDGFPLDQQDSGLNYINPNDIESFTILKDASSAAIYGSRATAGVILITTKSGKMQTPWRATFDTKFSTGNPISTVSLLNTEQFKTAVKNSGLASAAALISNGNTNWQDEIYRTAFGHDSNLTLSKGFKNSSLRVLFGYLGQQGTLLNTNVNRLSASVKYVQYLLDDNLRLEGNIRGARLHDNFGNKGAIGAAVSFDPTKEVNSAEKKFGGYYEWVNANGGINPVAPRNPASLLALTDDKAVTDRVLGSVKLDYTLPFVEGLKATANLGFNLNEVDQNVIIPKEAGSEFVNQGKLRDERTLNRSRLADVYVNYLKDLNSIGARLDLTAGHSYQYFYKSKWFAEAFGTGQKNKGYSNRPNEVVLISYLGRANMTFNDRFNVTASVRRDGSSRFSPENRWGTFYSVAGGWNIINEGFMKDNGLFSNLKLRAGYGLTGQQEIGPAYPYLPLYTGGDTRVSYPFGNEYIITLRPEEYDRNLRWEKSSSYNIGLDYGILGERISGSIDAYWTDVDDVLQFISIPAGSNLSNFITTNIGSVKNNGLEFALNTIPIENDRFRWFANFNIAFFDDEITKLTLNDDPSFKGVLTGGISGGVGNNIQINSVGFPQNQFYVYKQVYDTNGNPLEGVYEDRNKDGVINDSDKYRYKTPNADFTYGLTSGINYGNFDLNLTFRGSVGNYAYNNVASATGNEAALLGVNVISNVHSSFLDNGFKKQQLFSDYYVQDASFLKLDNITAGYNFNNAWRNGSNLRVFATIQNALTFTNYDGLDPEIFGGIDNNFYPRARTLLVGLSTNF